MQSKGKSILEDFSNQATFGNKSYCDLGSKTLLNGDIDMSKETE